MFYRFALVAVAALALAGTGCMKDVGSIEVNGVCALPDACTFASGGCSDFTLSRPVIDVSLTRTLQLYLNVTNQLAPLERQDGGVDTFLAYVDRITTSYTSLDPNIALSGSGSTTLGSIPPGTTSTVKMYVIDEVAGAALNAQNFPAATYVDMVAHVSVHGHLNDGTKFETAPYDLAFRACKGCLTACPTVVTCPPGADGQSPSICAAP